MSGRARLVSVYLGLQALAVTVFWLLLAVRPGLRPRLLPPGWPDEVLLAFALPDALVLTLGSAAAAWGVAHGRAWAPAVVGLAAGAAACATLWCIAAALLAGGGWTAALLMLPCAAGSLAALVASRA